MAHGRVYTLSKRLKVGEEMLDSVAKLTDFFFRSQKCVYLHKVSRLFNISH